MSIQTTTPTTNRPPTPPSIHPPRNLPEDTLKLTSSSSFLYRNGNRDLQVDNKRMDDYGENEILMNHHNNDIDLGSIGVGLNGNENGNVGAGIGGGIGNLNDNGNTVFGINALGESIDATIERLQLINNLQRTVLRDIVVPFYQQDLRETFSWRRHWLRLSRACLWTANLFLLASSIMNSLQIYIPNNSVYSMCAVIGNVVTLLLIGFSSEMKKESRNQTTNTNNLLKSVGLNTIHIPQSQETINVGTATSNNVSRLKPSRGMSNGNSY